MGSEGQTLRKQSRWQTGGRAGLQEDAAKWGAENTGLGVGLRPTLVQGRSPCLRAQLRAPELGSRPPRLVGGVPVGGVPEGLWPCTWSPILTSAACSPSLGVRRK